LIQCLQEQLIGGRLRQAEMEAMIRDMRAQLHELEEVTTRIRRKLLRRPHSHYSINCSLR
jgi:hypothetical protein